VAVGRALMVELELPTVCLDRARRTASARDLADLADLSEVEHGADLSEVEHGADLSEADLSEVEHGADLSEVEHRADLSEVEHGIEVALVAEDLDDAAEQLAELDARVGRLLEAEQSAPAARVRLAYWQARLLHAEGRHREAERVLRWALADAERLGLERLRWDLLMARARLSADMGEPVLDEVAALDRLADRLGQGHEARAEIALVEASASSDPLESIARLDRASDQLLGALTSWGPSGASLLFELMTARSKLHMRVTNFDAALDDAQAAVALAREPSLRDGERLARAQVLLAEASARAGRCELVSTALDGLATTLFHESQSQEAGGHLGWVLDFLHSFEIPAQPECVDAHNQAWMLATQLSIDGGGPR
jgi:hypothetical protein